MILARMIERVCFGMGWVFNAKGAIDEEGTDRRYGS